MCIGLQSEVTLLNSIYIERTVTSIVQLILSLPSRVACLTHVPRILKISSTGKEPANGKKRSL